MARFLTGWNIGEAQSDLPDRYRENFLYSNLTILKTETYYPIFR
jgi:hypothetical protein